MTLFKDNKLNSQTSLDKQTLFLSASQVDIVMPIILKTIKKIRQAELLPILGAEGEESSKLKLLGKE